MLALGLILASCRSPVDGVPIVEIEEGRQPNVVFLRIANAGSRNICIDLPNNDWTENITNSLHDNLWRYVFLAHENRLPRLKSGYSADYYGGIGDWPLINLKPNEEEKIVFNFSKYYEVRSDLPLYAEFDVPIVDCERRTEERIIHQNWLRN